MYGKITGGAELVLEFLDFTKSFTITTDTSGYALGAVLSQEGYSRERPVACASRRLTALEMRCSTLEMEVLGIVWAIDDFRPYVLGRRFRLHANHRPLQWVCKLKDSLAWMHLNHRFIICTWETLQYGRKLKNVAIRKNRIGHSSGVS